MFGVRFTTGKEETMMEIVKVSQAPPLYCNPAVDLLCTAERRVRVFYF